MAVCHKVGHKAETTSSHKGGVSRLVWLGQASESEGLISVPASKHSAVLGTAEMSNWLLFCKEYIVSFYGILVTVASLLGSLNFPREWRG